MQCAFLNTSLINEESLYIDAPAKMATIAMNTRMAGMTFPIGSYLPHVAPEAIGGRGRCMKSAPHHAFAGLSTYFLQKMLVLLGKTRVAANPGS
jgi:hypothetical protein